MSKVPTFAEAWSVKVAEGYQYGSDAIQGVRFGWDLRSSYAEGKALEVSPERPSWELTWMKMAYAVSARSYDPRLRVGAILVSCDNTQMLSLGYNGNYKTGPHEPESTEPGKSGYVHAEANCLIKADFNFHKKKHMYLTDSPCRQCAKLIINAEIARVVYHEEYRDTSGIELLKACGIEVERLDVAPYLLA